MDKSTLIEYAPELYMAGGSITMIATVVAFGTRTILPLQVIGPVVGGMLLTCGIVMWGIKLGIL